VALEIFRYHFYVITSKPSFIVISFAENEVKYKLENNSPIYQTTLRTRITLNNVLVINYLQCGPVYRQSQMFAEAKVLVRSEFESLLTVNHRIVKTSIILQ